MVVQWVMIEIKKKRNNERNTVRFTGAISYREGIFCYFELLQFLHDRFFLQTTFLENVHIFVTRITICTWHGGRGKWFTCRQMSIPSFLDHFLVTYRIPSYKEFVNAKNNVKHQNNWTLFWLIQKQNLWHPTHLLESLWEMHSTEYKHA